ncbi:hypothetical protein CBS101457_001760 [Exobasidium rhododendri]|nr:hypothetical protein CBS101457_001760 [Exobasidium rhododendri]
MVHLFFALTTNLALLTLAAVVSASSFKSRPKPHAVRFHRRTTPSNYPEARKTPPGSSLPPDWVKALNDAISAGKIPDIPVTSETASGEIIYPNKVGSHNTTTCSWTIDKCNGPSDIVDPPDGEWTIAFDDGPTADSPKLYKFLKENKQSGTHFMIGSQILAYPKAFTEAIATDQQIALHTWSHALLTTKDNMGVLAELGWNMQIIYDMSGRVPKLYRPPQGDLDNRVRAIASEVFNLTAVMWNYDTNDWCLDAGGKSSCPGEVPGESRSSVETAINKALDLPKSPGVSMLEHELNSMTIGLFTQYYPSLSTKGWKPQAVSDHYNEQWYANAIGNSDTPVNTTSVLASTTLAAVQKNQTSRSSYDSNGANRAKVKASSLTTTSDSSRQAMRSLFLMSLVVIFAILFIIS